MTEMNPEKTGVDTDGGQYSESSDFVPDPTDVTGTLDTSGTAGAEDSKVENVTPVFEAAKAQDLQYAAKALDPNDTSVDDPGAVVLPEDGTRTNEQAVEAVEKKAEAYKKDPVKVEDPSVQNAEKAKESGKSTDPAQVEAQQKGASGLGDLKHSDRSKDKPTG